MIREVQTLVADHFVDLFVCPVVVFERARATHKKEWRADIGAQSRP